MDTDHLVIPENATPEEIERNSCSYACNECGSLWDDQIREHAIRMGHWYCVQGADNHRPHKVGFHHRAWECLDISLAEIGAAWLRAKQGEHAAKVAWANGYEAIDFVEEHNAAVTEENLLRYRSDLPPDLVPPDTAALWLLVDTQQDSFYYELWSAGYAPEIRLHMVRHGIVQKFTDLEGLLQATWQDHENKQFRISNGLIDSGGTRRGWQKHSRTMEVYEWCSRNRVMIPIKGMHGRTGDLISFKTIATWPGTNKAIPGGLTRANLRVDLFKDELERLLQLDPDSATALSFHADIDEAFAKQRGSLELNKIPMAID
jgi:phage terminase large subunit GpA-like protein